MPCKCGATAKKRRRSLSTDLARSLLAKETVVVENVGDGTRRAAGAVMGLNDLVCVTPLQTIIADSEQEFDGLRWARPLGSDDV